MDAWFVPAVRCARRRTGRTLLLLLLALSVLPAACSTVPDRQPLRVMTYNIAAGGGDLDAIADVIRAAAPDVVGLQEVDVRWGARSGFADQAAALGSALGMHVRFGPIYDLPAQASADAGNRQFGLAVLSRAPIVQFTNHVIPRLSTQDSSTAPVPMPGFVEAIIDIAGVRLHVFNTHLDYRSDPRVREQQVAAMLAVMSPHTGPVILMGDLNAKPDAPELRPLLTRFTDAWSIHGDAGATYPANAPDRRIDYVMLSSHFRLIDARVPAAPASDHRPVVADVLLPTRGGIH